MGVNVGVQARVTAHQPISMCAYLHERVSVCLHACANVELISVNININIYIYIHILYKHVLLKSK